LLGSITHGEWIRQVTSIDDPALHAFVKGFNYFHKLYNITGESCLQHCIQSSFGETTKS